MMSRQDKDAGFTLVEMLVSMFIFSIISVGSLSALTGSLQSKDRIETKLNELRQIELSRAIIANDMANIVLRDNRDILGNPQDFSIVGGADSLLSFTRTGRLNPKGLEPRGDLERAQYLFEKNSLVRKAYAHENPGQGTPINSIVLLKNIARLDMEFINESGPQNILQIQSDETEISDFLVRLNIEFETGQSIVQYFEVSL